VNPAQRLGSVRGHGAQHAAPAAEVVVGTVEETGDDEDPKSARL
jgi:hypothetical protein